MTPPQRQSTLVTGPGLSSVSPTQPPTQTHPPTQNPSPTPPTTTPNPRPQTPQPPRAPNRLETQITSKASSSDSPSRPRSRSPPRSRTPPRVPRRILHVKMRKHHKTRTRTMYSLRNYLDMIQTAKTIHPYSPMSADRKKRPTASKATMG